MKRFLTITLPLVGLLLPISGYADSMTQFTSSGTPDYIVIPWGSVGPLAANSQNSLATAMSAGDPFTTAQSSAVMAVTNTAGAWYSPPAPDPPPDPEPPAPPVPTPTNSFVDPPSPPPAPPTFVDPPSPAVDPSNSSLFDPTTAPTITLDPPPPTPTFSTEIVSPFQTDISTGPEPSTFALMGAALGGLYLIRRRRKRSAV